MTTIPIIIDVKTPSVQVDGVHVGKEIVDSSLGLDISKVGTLAVADVLTRLKALPSSQLNAETQALLANVDQTLLISNLTRTIRLIIINNLRVLFSAASNESTMVSVLYSASVTTAVDNATSLPRVDNYAIAANTNIQAMNSELLPRVDNYNLVDGGVRASVGDPSNVTTGKMYGMRSDSVSVVVDYASNQSDVASLPMFRALKDNHGLFFGVLGVAYTQPGIVIQRSKLVMGAYSGIRSVSTPNMDLSISSAQVSTVNLTLSDVEFTGQYTPQMVFS